MAEHIYLEWLQDRIEVLTLASETSKTVKVSGEKELADHADNTVPTNAVGDTIRAWLDSLGVGKGNATVVLPREAVVLRKLQLPVSPEDDLPDLVRFQLQARASASIDSLSLDFVPLPTAPDAAGQDVISMTVDRDEVSRIVAILKHADLDVVRLTVSPLTVANLVRSTVQPKLGQTAPELVVLQEKTRAELSIVHQGTVIQSESVQLPVETADRAKALTSYLKRLIFAFEQSTPNARVESCYYVSGEADQSVTTVLRSTFPQRFEIVDANQVFGSKASGFEVLAGAAVAGDSRLSLDFLNPRKRREVSDKRKIYAAIGGLALVAVIGAGMTLFYSTKGKLEKENLAILGEKNDNIAKFKALDQMAKAHKQVAEWKQVDPNPIDVWNALREQMPTTGVLYLKDVTIRPDKGERIATFRGKGFAKNREAVYAFYSDLAKHNFDAKSPTINESKDDPDFPSVFELDLALLRPGAENKPKPNVAGKRG